MFRRLKKFAMIATRSPDKEYGFKIVGGNIDYKPFHNPGGTIFSSQEAILLEVIIFFPSPYYRLRILTIPFLENYSLQGAS